VASSPQAHQKKSDSKWLLSKGNLAKGKLDASIIEETPSFSDLLQSTLVVKTQGLISSPIDKWAAAAEVENKPDDAKAHSSHSSHTPTSSSALSTVTPYNPLKPSELSHTDLAYVSEEDEEDDDMDGDWEEIHSHADSIVLVINADGSFGPSLKSDVIQAAKKAKEKLELEQKEQKAQGKTRSSHGQSPMGSESGKHSDDGYGSKKERGQNAGSLVLKKQQHNNAQAAGSVIMSNYAKKALNSTTNVPYVTRASRLHLAADKIVIKVLQG
jgi:hypothetical protein